MWLVLQGGLQTFLRKSQPGAPNGLLADLQHLADFSIRFTFVGFQQDVPALDDHGFVSSFRNDPDQFPSFGFLQMDFMFFVCHPSILSAPYNLIKLLY